MPPQPSRSIFFWCSDWTNEKQCYNPSGLNHFCSLIGVLILTAIYYPSLQKELGHILH